MGVYAETREVGGKRDGNRGENRRKPQPKPRVENKVVAENKVVPQETNDISNVPEKKSKLNKKKIRILIAICVGVVIMGILVALTTCSTGYQNSSGFFCVDIDECKPGTENRCSVYAICTNTGSSLGSIKSQLAKMAHIHVSASLSSVGMDMFARI